MPIPATAPRTTINAINPTRSRPGQIRPCADSSTCWSLRLLFCSLRFDLLPAQASRKSFQERTKRRKRQLCSSVDPIAPPGVNRQGGKRAGFQTMAITPIGGIRVLVACFHRWYLSGRDRIAGDLYSLRFISARRQDNRPPGTNRGQHTQIGRLQAFMLARLGSAFFAARFFSPVRVSKT